jgi:hypothetical protein
MARVDEQWIRFNRVDGWVDGCIIRSFQVISVQVSWMKVLYMYAVGIVY